MARDSGKQEHLDGPTRPSARDSVARAQAAAAPKIAQMQAKAGPAVEKAAANAGKLLGTLRDRARTTVQEFSSAYGVDDERRASAPDAATDTRAGAGPAAAAENPPVRATDRPRPRPRPTSD